jgi:hypothetical protein
VKDAQLSTSEQESEPGERHRALMVGAAVGASSCVSKILLEFHAMTVERIVLWAVICAVTGTLIGALTWYLRRRRAMTLGENP